jgi:YesN/AraC family two-component response regulator
MGKILIVDDNAFWREMLAQSITAEFPGVQIAQAVNGKEAIAKVAWFRPNLIFMDVRLPDGTGTDLSKMIKVKYPETNVAILTSYDVPDYRKLAVECGAECFLIKGTSTPEDIFRLVRNHAYP